ncbi:hypothetical protein Sa4125_30850 [Aureimonas sp. SA4125]|uniref:GAF domain-containing hybrid sensor histidine kinase/response regulator n=1 Tax=Aureimonas sp. SA4125 TaxID=2826993 RepID=UPI001CC51DFF|nr:GAF domain-containing protein [Aureimonas sp. SA4125]BDA85543.1 hypothetical protein Sa4125_30850 [Aureimonas sp. SA4125]
MTDTTDSEAGTVTIERNWSASGLDNLAGVHRFSDYGSYIDDLRRGVAVAIMDVEIDPRTADNLASMRAIGVRAFLDVPLVDQGQTVAQFFVHSAHPRVWTDGEIGFVRDFAERTRAAIARRVAEQELRESKARLATAIDVARIGTFEWDFASDAVVLGDRAREILGFGADERVSGRSVFERIDPLDLARVQAAVGESRKVAGRLQLEFRVKLADGTRRSVVSISDGVVGLDGRVVRKVGVLDDVTARRSAEVRREALVELGDAIRDFENAAELSFAAAQILGRTLGVSRVGYGTVDHDGETLHVERDWTAPGVVSMAGTIPLRRYGSFVADLKHGVTTVVRDARSDGRTMVSTEELEALSGISFVTVPVMEHGRLVALLYANSAQRRFWHKEDVDLVHEFAERLRVAMERGRTAAALRASEARLRELNETLENQVAERTADRDRMWRLSTDLMLVARFDATITAVNPAWTSLLGWSADELAGRQFMDMVHPDDVAPTLEAVGDLSHGRTILRFVNRYRGKDGTHYWISWTAVPDSGFIHAVGRDVSAETMAGKELERAHEALRQSQKMEAVGQLTGGIAHDFNNLLAGISGSLELLQTRMAQGRVNEVGKYIVGAQGAAKRAAALTHRLLAFSRRQTLDPKPTDVNRLVRDMEELLSRTVGPSIRVETVAEEDLWSTLVDPNQLENALLNLCINARDAMPEGGVLTIGTSNRWLDERAARERDLPPGQYVSMCVSDNGTGMTPGVVERAFDPFFTTKPIGSGTGLGLSMIYGFARQSGGQVRIDSEVRVGTTVCIYLPRHHLAVEVEKEAPGPVEAPRAQPGETVLVIDDEPLVRMLVVDVLEELGYTALEAGDGPEGLAILRTNVHLDLLVTDVGLPNGMNGRHVAEAARQIRPRLKILFITGYAENAVLSHGQLDTGMQVIPKPFDMVQLAQRIRSMVEREPRNG